MQTFKRIIFWKKFSKYLTIGLSCFILLYFFQAQSGPLFAESPSCYNDTVSGLTPNGTTVPATQASVNLSWSQPANVPTSYYVAFRTAAGATVFEDYVYSTTKTVPVKPGTSYVWTMRPFYGGNCFGGLSQATVSVGSPQPIVCDNNQRIPCDNGDDSYYAYPDPNNNCSVSCANPNPAPGVIPPPSSSPSQPQTAYCPNQQGQLGTRMYCNGTVLGYDECTPDRYFADGSVQHYTCRSSVNRDTCLGDVTCPAQSQQSICNSYTDTRTTCLNQQLCTISVTHNASYCGSSSESGTYNCYNSSQCGFVPIPVSPQCTSIGCSAAPGNCYYVNQKTSTCTGEALTCGTLICPNPAPVVPIETPIVTPIITPIPTVISTPDNNTNTNVNTSFSSNNNIINIR